jgi:hypothetical protein
VLAETADRLRTEEAKDNGVAVVAAEYGPGPVAVMAATRTCVATFVVRPVSNAEVAVLPVDTIGVVQFAPESVETCKR